MPEKRDKTTAGKQETDEAMRLHLNVSLPTVFADGLQLLMRSDGLATLRWVQALPEFKSEVARVVVTQEHLRRIIDLLCRQTGHYPTPDKGAKGN